MKHSCYECLKIGVDSTMVEKRLEFTGLVQREKYTFMAMGIECPACGFKSLLGRQMDKYDIILADAYRAAHNLLTTNEIIGARNAFIMNQSEWAEFLGVPRRTVFRWEHGVIQTTKEDELIRSAGRKRE